MTVETLPEVIPAEKVTPIKPSEALRLGCLQYPHQITEALWDDFGGACAIGAMIVGSGGKDAIAHPPEMADLTDQSCPLCPFKPLYWMGMVTHLNDRHMMKRETIADFLEVNGL